MDGFFQEKVEGFRNRNLVGEAFTVEAREFGVLSVDRELVFEFVDDFEGVGDEAGVFSFEGWPEAGELAGHGPGFEFYQLKSRWAGDGGGDGHFGREKLLKDCSE